ncbi:MAG: hypothetical protein JF588_16345 [Caulobacterales bacterium]|nr:hypothetical protein [Caulobacterales bacterium]
MARARDSRGAAVLAYLAVLAVGVVAVLRFNYPGHLSWDSVSALHEGRFHVRETWNPAIYSWLLGVLDRISTNAVAWIGLSCALLFGAWAALAALRPRASWLAPVVALGVIALPQASIYPAIYWKDVLFAETALAGFVVLAFAMRHGARRPPWLALLAAAVLFAVAGLLRQNGLIFALAASVALTWAGWAQAGWRSLGRAVVWLLAVAVLTLAFSALLQPQGPGRPDTAGGKGVRLLQTYDMIAGLAFQPGRHLPAIERAEPAAGEILRTRAPKVYSPERIDSLSADPNVDGALDQVPSDQIRAEWVRLVTRDPGLYLRARLAAFRQVFATPIIDHCLPIEVGVEGPPLILKSLHMASRSDERDQRLYNYTTWFLDTPAMSHVAYAVLALGVMILLLVRREPADLMIAALLGGALTFAASFFVISIACDYRYLYALDMAALTGALYLALDPRLRRG